MNIAPLARRSISCTLVGLVLSFGGVALADKAIEKAKGQIADLRFDAAKGTATAALKKGTRGPNDVVDLYMLLGEVSASMGNDKDAENYFHSALSINLSATLEAGASPKLSEPFEAARRRLTGAEPITLDYESFDEGRVVVSVVSDPAKLVGGAALLYTENGEDQTKKGRGADKVNMKVPDGATDLKIVALDRYGNQLNEPIELEVESESGGTSNLGAGKTSKPGRPLFNRWQLYAGLSVVAAATGGYFAIKSKGFVDDAEALEDGSEFSKAKQLEDFAKEKALYANISFVAAALLAGTTYWVYATKSGSTEKPPAKATISPYLTSDEAGIAAFIQF